MKLNRLKQYNSNAVIRIAGDIKIFF